MHRISRSFLAALLVAATVSSSAFLSHELNGFSTTGDSLDLSQRDVRLFDNFTQAGLHENQMLDPNWPHETEVELALWKAAAEWGSLPFGDGSGDPSQPELGSGGANFDFFWNGAASGIGSTNDNIVSAIFGPGGGVTVLLELPSSDGWRMRVYEDLVDWDDGPGSVITGLDFQGVMTHQLGHALGLGHTSIPGSTMNAVSAGSAVEWRSIEIDDQAGVQWIYGAAGASKPRIDDLQGSTVPGGTTVLVGASFDPSNNEVWLNNALADGGAPGGEPFVLSGIGSTAGGTQLSFVVPASRAEAGGVHVKVPGTSGEHLSEGHPFGYGGPQNTFALSGPATGFVGSPVTYAISGAPAGASWVIAWSFTRNGSVFGGHLFDLGAPVTLAASGVVDPAGNAGWTSTPLPPAASGLTFFVEAAASSGGQLSDSNSLQLDVL